MTTTPQLLLLEDDLAFGVKLSMELEEAGFDVSRHTTATSALNYVTENHVDLIISDLLIKVDGELVPDGGVRLISKLSMMQSQLVPIIAMSSMFQAAYGSLEAKTTAMTVGAKATLPKPFKTAELIALIKRFLH